MPNVLGRIIRKFFTGLPYSKVSLKSCFVTFSSQAAGGAGDEVHGDALAQTAAPADTRIAEELGEAAAIPRASGSLGERTGAQSEASVERARVVSEVTGGKIGARSVNLSGERAGALSEACGGKGEARSVNASGERAGFLSGASGDRGGISQPGATVQRSSEPGPSPRSTQDKAGLPTQERATTPSATQGKERPEDGQPGGNSARSKERRKAGGKRGETGPKGGGFKRNRHAIAVVETVRGKLEGRINAVIPSVPASSRYEVLFRLIRARCVEHTTSFKRAFLQFKSVNRAACPDSL